MLAWKRAREWAVILAATTVLGWWSLTMGISAAREDESYVEVTTELNHGRVPRAALIPRADQIERRLSFFEPARLVLIVVGIAGTCTAAVIAAVLSRPAAKA